MKKSWPTRARLIAGVIILIAAVITWFMALSMSPHDPAGSGDSDYFRTSVVVFLRNSAFGNLILCGLAAWLLYPSRRPDKPVRDWVIFGVIAVIVLTSVYQLFWLRSVTH